MKYQQSEKLTGIYWQGLICNLTLKAVYIVRKMCKMQTIYHTYLTVLAWLGPLYVNLYWRNSPVAGALQDTVTLVVVADRLETTSGSCGGSEKVPTRIHGTTSGVVVWYFCCCISTMSWRVRPEHTIGLLTHFSVHGSFTPSLPGRKPYGALPGSEEVHTNTRVLVIQNTLVH